jgi:8-oxo-dGTP pyrophosphatase MutT (NUDIX family)
MTFDSILKSIPKIENISLPGQVSQFKMVPPFRQELVKKQEENIKNAKQSAVLALLYPGLNKETYIVLILRKTYKGVHSAQIGFPGGRVEEDDESFEHTALRETFEEVGVPEKDVIVVKELTDVYIPPSNFFVQPFLGYTKAKPAFVRQESEVEAVLEVKLSDLLDDNYLDTISVSTSYKVDVEAPAFKLNGHVVWGATAMMLSEIKDILKASL